MSCDAIFQAHVRVSLSRAKERGMQSWRVTRAYASIAALVCMLYALFIHANKVQHLLQKETAVETCDIHKMLRQQA